MAWQVYWHGMKSDELRVAFIVSAMDTFQKSFKFHRKVSYCVLLLWNIYLLCQIAVYSNFLIVLFNFLLSFQVKDTEICFLYEKVD